MIRPALPTAAWASLLAIGLVLLPLVLVALAGAAGADAAGPLATWDGTTAPAGGSPRVAVAARLHPWVAPAGTAVRVERPGPLDFACPLARREAATAPAPLAAEVSRLL